MNAGDTKNCPACAEPVLVAARKCKHCGEWFAEAQQSSPVVAPPVSAEMIYRQAHAAHYAGDTKAAIPLYQTLLANFAGTPEAGYAHTQLTNIDHNNRQVMSSGVGGPSAGASHSAPRQGNPATTSAAGSHFGLAVAAGIATLATALVLAILFYRVTSVVALVLLATAVAMCVSRPMHRRVLRLFGKRSYSRKDLYRMLGVAVISGLCAVIALGVWVRRSEAEAARIAVEREAAAADLAKARATLADIDVVTKGPMTVATANYAIRQLATVSLRPETRPEHARLGALLFTEANRLRLEAGDRFIREGNWNSARDVLREVDETSPQRAQAEHGLKKAEGELVRQRYESAVAAMARTATGTQTSQLAAFRRLRTTSKSLSKAGLEGHGGKLHDAIDTADQIDQLIERLRAELKPVPAKPEKPSYEKPSYLGPWRLSGTVWGQFDQGGIIVRRGRNYYLVENATPDSGRVTGYVENTGRTIMVTIADGRAADVVRLTDSQAYREAKELHREFVAQAKAEYREAEASYKDALKGWERLVKQRRSDEKDLERAERRLAGPLERLARVCVGIVGAD